MIYFVDDVGPSPLAQSVAFRDLPLRDVGQHPLFFYFWKLVFSMCYILNLYATFNLLFQVLFISEKMVIGVGYDSNPMVFAADDTGIWCVTLRNICLIISFLTVCI